MKDNLNYWIGEIKDQIINHRHSFAESIKEYRIARLRSIKLCIDTTESDKIVQELTKSRGSSELISIFN